jgi:hypothetical protein
MSSWGNYPDNPEDYIGFIYIIENLISNRYYIGQKKLLKKTRLKPTKTRKRSKIVWKDNDVEEYFGSSRELLADVEKYGKDNFKKTIIELCTSKWHMSYAELCWQLEFNAIMDPNSYNGIINIRLNAPPKGYIDIKRRKSDLALTITNNVLSSEECRP